MHYFAAQFQPGQQTTHSLRASQYRLSKRKRDEDAEEPPTSPEGEDDARSRLASSRAQSYASVDWPEADQLRVAGLLPDDAFEIPSRPFPHAPARTSKVTFNYNKIQKDLAELIPPLFAVEAKTKSHPIHQTNDAPALRQNHLGVLTTIMHRCLLEGDYQRAGRAWGMILRSQIAGSPVDPRNHGRWGIGAEILLHRNSRMHSSDSHIGRNIAADGQSSSKVQSIYTEEGFELAREYYERLIVQHPNRKTVPHAINDMTFYPAMFSLWIYEVCEKRRRAQRQFEEENSTLTSGNAFDEDTIMTSEEVDGHASAIVAEELQQAKAIANRLDQLIISPPFDKHADLLRLRRMVGLWIGDLMLRKEARQEDGWNTSPDDHEEAETSGSKFEA